MKTRVHRAIFAVVFCLFAHLNFARAQGTAFTYQGRLNDGGSAANGNYDLTFSLYATSSGGSSAAGPLTNTVAVSNGLFTATLDFGPGVFNGASYWLQIGVRTNGSASFTTLTTRQELTPSPYAIFATSAATAGTFNGTVPSGGLSGTYTGPVIFNNPTNSFTGDGTGLTNVNAGLLNGQAASDFWNTAGNSGTSPTSGNFIGTADNQPLEARVNGRRAFRFEPTTSDSPNIIGGAAANFVLPGVVGATIAGGGTTNDNFSTETNSVSANFASIGGGSGHTINTNADHAAIAGGKNNLIDAGSSDSVIGGGAQNSIFQNTDHSLIGGGYFNIIVPFFGSYDSILGGENNSISGAFVNDSVISGGNHNQAQNSQATVGGGAYNIAGAAFSTVSGGASNSVSANFSAVSGGYSNSVSGQTAFVAGGELNNAAADRTFAAGTDAQANHQGAFVWADFSTNASAGIGVVVPFASSNRNEFAARATGGVRFVSSVNTSSGAPLAGVSLAPGGTAWATISDRNAKKDFAPVDPQIILEKLAAIPVEQWRYKWEDGSVTPNIGPMAQDFIQAFYPGRNDKSITTLEFDGVELAAIQGLNRKLQAKDAEIADLKSRLEKLESIVEQQKATQAKP